MCLLSSTPNTSTTSKFRKTTDRHHPLFDGDPLQYQNDQRWRADIAKAGVDEIEIEDAAA